MNWFKKIIVKYGLRKSILTTAMAMVICIGVVIVYQQCENNQAHHIEKDVLILEKDSEVYEYGDIISLNPVDYVAEGTSQDVLNKINVNLKKVVGSAVEKVENTTAKQEVGTYYIVFTYGEEKEKVKIEVIDNTAPVISLKKMEVTLEYGSSFNAKDYVESVKDPVDGDLVYAVEGNVNTKKAGVYKVSFIAEDKHGNKAENAILQVTVKEKKQNNKPSSDKSNKEEGKIPTSPSGTNSDGSGEEKDTSGAGSSNTHIKDDNHSSDNAQSSTKENNESDGRWTVDTVPSDVLGNSQKAFTTVANAKEWAEKEIKDGNSKWYGKSYTIRSCTPAGMRFDKNKDPRTVDFH